ncbi:hypothetical protein [Radiobacillus deserti]|uniref:Uncharacterized protein n=1 Tax=Radiobacillus deserti TaxID=2594883 RepID=A0A516KEI9_9BACI|nr:hypothetical protein [Radiobacillus deserti]QDP39777.1 hypothetical protein FN924_06085 [Radiobacillus deserti]
MSELEQLKIENAMLRKQLNEFIYYINHLPAFEYHFDKIKVEKVKGTLQLGELLESDNDKMGIHKIFVKELEIREIEGTGTVGVGITEKKASKSKPDIIPPEAASPTIKKHYEQIKETLDIQVVPLFFQKLAVRENVLELTWENLKRNWEDLHKEYPSFREKVKEKLKKIHSVMKKYVSSNMIIRPDLVKKVNEDIEAQLKAWWLLLGLSNEMIPGFLHRLKREDFQLKKVKLNAEEEILTNIKDAYQLQHLPMSLQVLDDYEVVLDALYTQLLVPINKVDKDQEFIWEIYQGASRAFESEFNVDINLDAENLAFLLSNIMEQTKLIPKYLVLELGVKVIAE